MTPTAQRVRADKMENFILEMDVYGLVWMVIRGEYVNGPERFSSRDELLYFFLQTCSCPTIYVFASPISRRLVAGNNLLTCPADNCGPMER